MKRSSSSNDTQNFGSSKPIIVETRIDPQLLVEFEQLVVIILKIYILFYFIDF